MVGISYTEENQHLRTEIQALKRENAQLRKELEENELENRLDYGHVTIEMGVIFVNNRGIVLDASPDLCANFHVDRWDIIGNRIMDFIHQDDQSLIRKHIRKLNQKLVNPIYDKFSLTIQEAQYFVEIITSKLPDGLGFVSVVRNIVCGMKGQQKKLESKFIDNEFFTEALDGIVLWKENGEVIAANKAAMKIFECTLEEMLHSKISDYIYMRDEKYHQMVKNFYLSKSIRDELIFLMPNGQKKILEFTTKQHAVEDLHMSIFRNVTERHGMEEKLRESKTMFENIFGEVFDGIIIWDEQYRIIDMNKEAERLLNENKERLVGCKILDYFPVGKTIGEDIHPKIRSLKEDGQNRGVYTAHLTNKKGVTQLEFRNKYNIYSGLSITTLRDITENTFLAEQLRKSSTLNVVGELAAGIAHEIRNPMTSLKGFIQLLESSTACNGNEMYFSVIKSELNRIETIVTEFLFLAKPQTVHFERCNLGKIMNETIELLNAQAVLHNVQFHKHYDLNLPDLYCESNQMKKVFINLIKNAIEVLQDGGDITVTIEYKDEYYHIAISDNGIGMSKEKLERIGEPFYTTKENGTGLGLLVTSQIIEEHLGRIEVESEFGDGTTFHIFLPDRKNENKA